MPTLINLHCFSQFLESIVNGESVWPQGQLSEKTEGEKNIPQFLKKKTVKFDKIPLDKM